MGQRRIRPSGRTLGASTRHRRPRELLEDEILQAAWEELARVGYASLTIEGVARRAGTGKAVLYRRWPSRAELVFAALRRFVPEPLSGNVPDTGDVREDVLVLLRRQRSSLEAFAPDVVHGLAAERHEDEGVGNVAAQAQRAGCDAMLAILERAAERGQVRLDKVSRRIASLPLDLVRHDVLLMAARVTDEQLMEIVDDLLLPLVQA